VSDPRLTLARGGVASAALRGLIEAEHYLEPRPQVCWADSAAIRAAPEPRAEQVDQLLFGEAFEVLDIADGWALGQARRDRYVGYVDITALGAPGREATHRVAAVRTCAFPEPDYRSTPPRSLSLNAPVAVVAREGRFALVEGAGWVPAAHLAEAADFDGDPVAVAERFIGSPYVWGGRESTGLDCSGLVQAAFYACGRDCPRDADMQSALGVAADPSDLQRGDLVFWPRHVALVVDAKRIIHGNAHHMAVAVEPLAEAVARIEAAGVGPTVAFRRP
jgi:cell wall-associated NlpC family hydrolase